MKDGAGPLLTRDGCATHPAMVIVSSAAAAAAAPLGLPAAAAVAVELQHAQAAADWAYCPLQALSLLLLPPAPPCFAVPGVVPPSELQATSAGKGQGYKPPVPAKGSCLTANVTCLHSAFSLPAA
jgi:hypothetical protein